MSKADDKKRAIAEVINLMKGYVEYVDSVQEQPFNKDVKDQLKSKGDIIRWLQQGIESGYYDAEPGT